MNKSQPINFASAGPRETKALIAEIATRAKSIDMSFFGFLPNPDPVLKAMGKDQAVYEQIMVDGHLTGVMASRASGVKSLLWEIDRGKSKSRPAKDITALFKRLDMNRIIDEILEGNYRGYQPLEVIWAKPGADGKIGVADIVGKPPEWFQFDDLNQLRFRTRENPTGDPVPDRKFLLSRRKASFKNPYGEALLSKCFWPATFKQQGIKFLVTFAEKFGIPYLVGKLPRGASEQEYEELKNLLEEMVADACAAIPEDGSVEILANGTGANSPEVFLGLGAWADGEMSKVILGHGAAADSTPGKLGGEDSAEGVKDFLVLEDKRLVERVLNQFIRWYFEVNYGGGDAPEFVMYAEEDVDLDQATRDKTLSDQGVKFTKKYYMETYGFEEDDLEDFDRAQEAEDAAKLAAAGAKGKPPAEFKEGRPSPFPDQAALDAFMEDLKPADLQEQAEGILKPVIKLIQEGQSFEEIQDKLAAVFRDMDSSALEKMLHRAYFVSEMMGEARGR